MNYSYTAYHQTPRGLRKVAARNGCKIERTAEGWDVFDAETNALVAFSCSAVEVLSLF